MSETSTISAEGSGLGVRRARSVEVSWGDCDAAGVVFYPRYYAWFDLLTHGLLGSVGLSHRSIGERYGGAMTPLVHAEADFRSSASHGDVLEAVSVVARVGGRSFTVRHRLSLGERLVVEGAEVRVWGIPVPGAGVGFTAAPIPEEVRRRLLGEAG